MKALKALKALRTVKAWKAWDAAKALKTWFKTVFEGFEDLEGCEDFISMQLLKALRL